MHFALFLLFTIMLLDNSKCSYVLHNDKFDKISDNFEMFLKPIKKISGIFPNHEFELQFDLEQVGTERSSGDVHPRHPHQPIIRSKNITIEGEKTILPGTTTTNASHSAPASSELTSDPDNHIVYMKDLKNALEDYEKKHAKDQTTESPNLLSSFSDNPALSDVLQLIKRGAKLQNDMPTSGDSDLSWIKIKVPAALRSLKLK